MVSRNTLADSFPGFFYTNCPVVWMHITTEIELRRCFIARLVPKPKHHKLNRMFNRRYRIAEK
jgi:hypothetical protein